MNPTPIPKTGTTRHFYCEVCKDDGFHLIRVHKTFYEKQVIHFWALCLRCWGRHLQKKEASDKHPELNIVVPDMVLDLNEMSFTKWNEFIKWGNYD